MSFNSGQVTTCEPESDWYLCSYRGWLLAVLPSDEGFLFEYLAPDGTRYGLEPLIHPSVGAAIKQAKIRIKRRVTIWLMEQWLCEMQEQGTIDIRDYYCLCKSLY